MREQKFFSLMITVIIFCFFALPAVSIAEEFILETDIRAYTPQWEGERFPDGRPKVPDAILERMKKVSIEEAWGVLDDHGYKHQFEGGWVTTGEPLILVGRALTSVFMPLRPDVNDASRVVYEKDGSGYAGHNKTVINMLVENDVVVVDLYGKVFEGTFIGDNFANNIYALSKNGMVVDGGSRDMDGVKSVRGFVTFTRGWDPTALQNSMLMGVNTPIRIGRATAMPGDVVLGGSEGIIFIPPHLAQEVVERSEIVRLKDEFNTKLFQEEKYPLELIYGHWNDEMKKDYDEYVKEQDRKGRLTPYQRKMLLK